MKIFRRLNEEGFILMMMIIAILGNIGAITGTIATWILDIDSKYVWLFSVIGWSFFAGALQDLFKTTEKYNKENEK